MRNLNNEYQDNDRRYNYDFDLTLRGYMLRSFLPFFPDPSRAKALELGCFEGGFTELLTPHFQHLTVVEGSSDLIEKTRNRIGGSVHFVHSLFENFSTVEKFDSIFLIHTLEHLDQPAVVLKKIKDWLSPTGRLFLAVPNANAPSRQIAVRMGLISHNQAVTKAEFDHGHRKTYAFDTLESEVLSSGLKIYQRGGVFFKPFANFQFDRFMKEKLISNEYLEGCYELGMVYPDLCASIFLLCGN